MVCVKQARTGNTSKESIVTVATTVATRSRVTTSEAATTSSAEVEDTVVRGSITREEVSLSLI